MTEERTEQPTPCTIRETCPGPKKSYCSTTDQTSCEYNQSSLSPTTLEEDALALGATVSNDGFIRLGRYGVSPIL